MPFTTCRQSVPDSSESSIRDERQADSGLGFHHTTSLARRATQSSMAGSIQEEQHHSRQPGDPLRTQVRVVVYPCGKSYVWDGDFQCISCLTERHAREGPQIHSLQQSKRNHKLQFTGGVRLECCDSSMINSCKLSCVLDSSFSVCLCVCARVQIPALSLLQAGLKVSSCSSQAC